MVSVSLYVDDVKLDLFNDENISLTQSIQNVRDISKVFANFTQAFTVPASRVNNKVFKHYYNFSIDNGFDARKKVDAKIELNYLPFQNGKVQLLGAVLKNNEVHSYKIIFYGNIVELKDTLGENKLSALSWLSNFTREFSANNVLSDLQSDGVDFTIDSTLYPDALVMPLITNTTQLFYAPGVPSPPYFNADGEIDPAGANIYPNANFSGLYYEELKYAIRVWLIVEAIEKTYNISFHPDSFLKKKDNPQYYDLYMWLHREKGYAFKPTTVTDQYTSFPSDTTTLDRVFCSPSTLTVINTPTPTITYALVCTQAAAEDFTVSIYRTGDLYQEQTFPKNITGTILSGVLANGNYTVFVTSAPSTTVEFEWQITDGLANATFSGTPQALSSSNFFNAQQQVPDIRIIDFLTGLFKMFNLTAYKLLNGQIMVQTLDNYYETGTLRRIDDYIDITESQVDAALPFKEVKFEYKGRGTKLAQLYEQQEGTGWGTEEYRQDNDFLGDQYLVEVPFEHMQFEKFLATTIQVGYSTDDNNDAYIGMPLLFYRELITNGTQINFLTSGATAVTIDDYCVPLNSVSKDSATSNKVSHFFPEINEYTPTETFDGTLFNEYYNTYITQAFDNKRRLFKYKAILPVGFLYKYSLKDTLQIYDTTFIINQITTNLTTGQSSLELLNVMDQAYISPTSTTTTTSGPTTTTTQGPTTTLGPTTTTTSGPTTTTTQGPTTTTTTQAPPTVYDVGFRTSSGAPTSSTACGTANTTLYASVSTFAQVGVGTTIYANTGGTLFAGGNLWYGIAKSSGASSIAILIGNDGVVTNDAVCVPPTTQAPTTTEAPTLYYRFEACEGGLLVWAQLPSEPSNFAQYVDDLNAYYRYIGPPTPSPGSVISLYSTGNTGCPVEPTTTAPPQYLNAAVQLCGGFTVWYVQFTSFSSLPNGFVIKGNGGTLGTDCWQITDNEWSGAIDFTSTATQYFLDCDNCLPPTTTTTFPPPQSWFSERNDTLVTGYITIAQGYNTGDQVLVNDGSGICWTVGELSTTAGQYSITGACPPPTTTLAPTTTQAPTPCNEIDVSNQTYGTLSQACSASPTTNRDRTDGDPNNPQVGDTVYEDSNCTIVKAPGIYQHITAGAAIQIGGGGLITDVLFC